MPRIIETVVCTIDELSDHAREAARAWLRECGMDDDWDDFVLDDFATVCRILGVTLDTRQVRLFGGGTRDVPRIFWSGFWNQGDGASFQGWWSHARGACRAIRAHAPKDTQLHRIADALQAVQRRNFFQLHATIRQRGRHCHENTMAIAVERDSPTWQPPTDGAEDAVTEALRDLARWLYSQLRAEHEHQTSDAVVDEILAANAYTFTEDGTRFG